MSIMLMIGEKRSVERPSDWPLGRNYSSYSPYPFSSTPDYNWPENKIFPSWAFRDDTEGGYRSGSGPFFIARKTASYVSARSNPNASPNSGWACLRPTGDMYRKLVVGSETAEYYQRSYYGVSDGEMCYLVVVCQIRTTSAGKRYWYGDDWHRYPIKKFDTIPDWGRYYKLTGYKGYWNSTPRDYRDENNPDLTLNWLEHHLLTDGFSGLSKQESSASVYPCQFDESEPIFGDLDSIGLKHGEYGFWAVHAEQAVAGLSGSKDLHAGNFTIAYRKACNALPSLHSNTIANVIETIELIGSLVNGLDLSDIKKIGKSFSKASDLGKDAWLRYRYQYNTTKADLEELTSAIVRLDSMLSEEFDLTSYGHSSDSTGHFYCAICTTSSSVIRSRTLKDLGLAPSLANAWDMVPFSFMVDWILQISTVLEGIEDWLYEPTLRAQYWYSYTNSYQDDTGATIDVFFRYRGGKQLLPCWEYSSARDKTWWMRFGDVISIFT